MASIDSLLRELARAPERDPEPAALLHYRILRKIGEGGMGAVYKAHDEKLGRIVALKRVSRRPEGDEQARSRLLREARAASALNHPNIVTIHAVEEAEGDEFIVMEYVEGETLEALLRNGPLPPGQVLALGAEVADALACADDACYAAKAGGRDRFAVFSAETASGAGGLNAARLRVPAADVAGRGSRDRRVHVPGAAPRRAPRRSFRRLLARGRALRGGDGPTRVRCHGRPRIFVRSGVHRPASTDRAGPGIAGRP